MGAGKNESWSFTWFFEDPDSWIRKFQAYKRLSLSLPSDGHDSYTIFIRRRYVETANKLYEQQGGFLWETTVRYQDIVSKNRNTEFRDYKIIARKWRS